MAKVDNIDTTNFVKYEKDGSNFEDKIPDVTSLVKKQILIPNLLK